MALWVPTQGPRWAFRCPAEGLAFGFSSFPGTPPLLSSSRLCLPFHVPRDGLFGATEGPPNSLSVPPKGLRFSSCASWGPPFALWCDPEPCVCLWVSSLSPLLPLGTPMALRVPAGATLVKHGLSVRVLSQESS